MKQEERLKQLFKAAKEEEAQFSYEMLAKQFKQSHSTATILKKLISKAINMNTLFIILIGGCLSILWYNSPTPSSTILEKKDSVSNDTVLPKIQSPSFTSTEEKPSAIPKNTSLSSPVVSAEKKVFIEEGETESILIDEDSSNTNRIKSFNFSPILSLEENEEQQTTEIKSKNQLIPPELTSPIIFHQLLKINWQDDAKQILKIKQSMEDVGFEVQKLTTSRKKKDIDKVYMHLTHPKGLDWRFTVRDFEQIELKIMLDNKIGLRAFAYRFNEKGDFSNLIQLTEKSVSKHRVSSGTKGRHITRKKKQD